MTKRITFGDLNASHAGATVIINDGRQILHGTIDTIAHYLDQGVTGISLKGHRLAVQRAHTWPVTISKPATIPVEIIDDIQEPKLTKPDQA